MMKTSCSKRLPNRAAVLTGKTFSTLDRFIHIEAVSGLVLIIATAVALILANSRYSGIYQQFWQQPLRVEFIGFSFSKNLHFLVNDVLMTVFFLVAGLEIRRELHEGALAEIKLALLPIIAAIGGVCFPAFIYFAFNGYTQTSHGWAVPTATDIAFAVGILALLGKSIPSNLKVVLLSLAIIDDIIAIIVIALFYSSNLDVTGLPFVFGAILLILLFQWIGIEQPWIYVVPGIILWWGLMVFGVHPSLAGVIMGLLTPVLPPRAYISPVAHISNALEVMKNESANNNKLQLYSFALHEIRKGQNCLLAPASRVQMALAPWVSFIIMPLFALANAGINFSGYDLSSKSSSAIILGIGLGLVVGKPIGIVCASFFAIKCGICKLPRDVNWHGLLLVGLLGGIGFTMAIFTATLAFSNDYQLSAAKLAILCGSLLSAIFGLGFGLWQLYAKKI